MGQGTVAATGNVPSSVRSALGPSYANFSPGAASGMDTTDPAAPGTNVGISPESTYLPGVPTATPSPAPVVHQSPVAALQARAEVIFGSLNHQAAPEGDLDARAMIWAGASYLYHQQGEDQSIEFPKTIQAKLSIAAWLEQLPIAGLPRN